MPCVSVYNSCRFSLSLIKRSSLTANRSWSPFTTGACKGDVTYVLSCSLIFFNWTPMRYSLSAWSVSEEKSSSFNNNQRVHAKDFVQNEIIKINVNSTIPIFVEPYAIRVILIPFNDRFDRPVKLYSERNLLQFDKEKITLRLFFSVKRMRFHLLLKTWGICQATTRVDFGLRRS